jgi:predicted small metal-binding protein
LHGYPKGGLLIESHDEKEIAERAIKHAKKAHSMVITEKDVGTMMKDAQQGGTEYEESDEV